MLTNLIAEREYQIVANITDGKAYDAAELERLLNNLGLTKVERSWIEAAPMTPDLWNGDSLRIEVPMYSVDGGPPVAMVVLRLSEETIPDIVDLEITQIRAAADSGGSFGKADH